MGMMDEFRQLVISDINRAREDGIISDEQHKNAIKEVSLTAELPCRPDVSRCADRMIMEGQTRNQPLEVSTIEPPTPPIALVSGPIAEAFGLTNNPAVEVSTIDPTPLFLWKRKTLLKNGNEK